MKLQFAAKSENESFARVAVASFISQLDPTLEEINDIKTVVSEAVTNSIIHGYEEDEKGIVTIYVSYDGEMVELTIEDNGKGIEDVESALQPLYTTKPELERSGMGFTIMENLMDDMEVESKIGEGTKVVLRKRFAINNTVN
ncbi:anti-sigma F factor [Vulcanibacillus modesticaldus]|uniref:Anti-sigma F factor n=1 Tax=Vulcanibacillus modesticaldus TaxID=337097 RepID=A0A1D2YSK8_9BACI|nr:anti-sigma F factor [Vulcanibacillus modesticaldus]OEF97302.1 anti-sigma F factor [Vulcanibacillus modesticaldus]